MLWFCSSNQLMDFKDILHTNDHFRLISHRNEACMMVLQQAIPELSFLSRSKPYLLIGKCGFQLGKLLIIWISKPHIKQFLHGFTYDTKPFICFVSFKLVLFYNLWIRPFNTYKSGYQCISSFYSCRHTEAKIRDHTISESWSCLQPFEHPALHFLQNKMPIQKIKLV